MDVQRGKEVGEVVAGEGQINRPLYTLWTLLLQSEMKHRLNKRVA